MYSTLPPKYRRRVQASLVAGWFLLACSGLSAILSPPSIALAELGPTFTYAWGTLLTVASITAGVAVLAQRYRWEWVASWLAAGGILPLAITLWTLTFVGYTSLASQSFMVTTVFMMCVKRAVSCSAHAAKLRDMHEEVSRVADS